MDMVRCLSHRLTLLTGMSSPLGRGAVQVALLFRMVEEALEGAEVAAMTLGTVM